MIRLLLVEDHEALRTSLAFLLSREPDFTVVADVSTIEAARAWLGDVDVALIDLDLPDANGTTLIPEIRHANPNAISLVLTGSKDIGEHALALESGATGVIHKAVSIEEVKQAIRRAVAGEPVNTQTEMMAMLRFAASGRQRSRQRADILAKLTPRERELLHALAKGLSDREIALQLNVSVRTVQSHMLNLMDKLDVHSRLQALITAIRYRIVSIPTE